VRSTSWVDVVGEVDALACLVVYVGLGCMQRHPSGQALHLVPVAAHLCEAEAG
jgi:hypothetical protein